MTNIITQKIINKTSYMAFVARRCVAHAFSRYSNSSNYQIIDSYVRKYRAMGGLKSRYQHYKLFCLSRLLKNEKPGSIIEFGTGSSTTVFADYVRNNPGAHLTCVDESEQWLEDSRKIAGISDSDDRFRMIAADRLFLNDDELKQIKYDVDFEEEFDCVFIDGPDARVDGVKHKDAINPNVFDITKRRLPRMIIVDIRWATVEAIQKRLGDKYEIFVSDIIKKKIGIGYRYFSVFKLK